MNVAAYRELLQSGAGRPQALLPESLGLAVYGYRDEQWDEWHGSETMGPDTDHDLDYDDAAYDEYVQIEEEQDVLHRWNRPDDDLEVLDLIAENGLQIWNTEILQAFRRAQLHTVCCEYFGTKDYAGREIVLRWSKSESGRWVPAEKMLVRDWIEGRIAENGGSNLAGYYSALQTLRFKLVGRDKKTKFAPNRRVLNSEQTRSVVAKAVAVCSDQAEQDYLEL